MADANKKILIVEDDKSFLWILRESFVGAGFSVVFAQDGQEGLKMVEEENPDLILLDIMMPIMDGIEMAKQMKEKGLKNQIIFLTNMSDINYMNKAEETFPSEYIIKSEVHIDQIVSRAKEKLGKK